MTYKSKKHNDSLFGDDFETEGAGMQQFENYEEYNVDKQTTEVFERAKAIITSISDAYLSLPEVSDDDPRSGAVKAARALVENVKYIESSNLSLMIEQVHIAKHLLHTMLRRLDSGGYTENSLYEMIQEQQKQVMQIIMQFSKYARNLPDYFAITRSEMKLQSKLDDIAIQQAANSHESAMALPPGEAGDEFSNTSPIRGTLDMALRAQEAIRNMQSMYDKAEDLAIDFDPDDLVDSDEDFDQSEFAEYTEED